MSPARSAFVCKALAFHRSCNACKRCPGLASPRAFAGPGLKVSMNQDSPYSSLQAPSRVWLMPALYAALSWALGRGHGDEQVVKLQSSLWALMGW